MTSEWALSAVGYAAVGILWGCSNPFIKHGQAGQGRTEKSSVLGEIYSLLSKPRLLIPFMVNQSGSLVYYYMLSSEPVSRASPICNALTFLFTAITGYFCFGEEVQNPLLVLLGVLCILLGVYICLME
ncbi:hypothetical protein B484DRAFT_326837 [Ochromonadaceae sp. CCMP2298]|nr:hypothetical protein B484DRAFT_326837 [Ochromonadaceae sp. CCMP2298]